MLFALLLACVGVMKAEVTKFYKPGERVATLTTGQKVMFYNTCFDGTQDRTGFLIDNGSNFGLSKQKPSASPIFSEKVGVLWTIELAEDNTSYYKVNVMGANGYVGIGGKTNNAAAQDMYIHKWTVIDASKRAGVKSEQADGTVIENTAIAAGDNVWLVANGATADAISTTWNGNTSSFATWSTGHPYAIYSVVEATPAELEELLTQAKATAKATLAELAKMPLYTVGTAADDVDAVAMESNDLETALNAIDAIVLNVKKTVDGKNVTFQNHGTDDRNGRYLGYDKKNSRAAAIKSDDNGNEAIWTLKACNDGTFKLYNFVNDLYLGDPNSAATHAEEATAPSFRFAQSTDPNNPSTFVLVCSNGKWVHVQNDANNNYKLMHYESTTDGASLWTVSEVGAIHATRDDYNAKKTVLNDLMAYAKQLQDEVGLVANGEKVTVVVNHPSGGDSQPSSNLLDGNNSTFVHSSYDGGTMNTVDNHYIEVELSEPTRNIFCYFSKRNNNNRPAVIKVLAGNSAEAITTEVTTLNMGESYDNNVQSYFSKGIDLGAEYTHLRFVVTLTNTNTKFFTLSEFYVLPINDETQYISNLTSASITDATFNTKVAEAQSYLKGFLFAGVWDVLQANKENHAAEPALGQYTTEAYEALTAAYKDDAATQESLEEAVAAFEAAKNVPVYFITSAWDGGYSAGSAIYYDGAWKWKTANIYDRQMWMTIPNYTNADVPVVDAFDANGTSYQICDYLTGTVMRGKSVQIVKIADWEGAYNLQYNADATSTDAAQHAQSGGALVNWKSALVNDCQASAWHVEYIGSSYDLDKLTDEYLAKGNELLEAYNKVPNFSIAAGVNNYSEATPGSLAAAKEDVLAALNAFSTEEQIATAKSALEAAVAQVSINMPENGKFYRVRCTDGNRRILSTLNTDGSRLTLANTVTDESIYCYTDGALLSYTTGLYMNAYNFNAVGASTAVTIQAAHTGTVGCYNIKVGDRWIYGAGGTIDSGTGDNPDNRAGYRWWLEEVTTLPVAVSEAGYATLYAPVALEVPAEGVTAHTVTVNDKYAVLSEPLDVIPAETGVILVGTKNTHNFKVATTDETATSALDGTFAKTYVKDDAYVLANKDGIGLYKAAVNVSTDTSNDGTDEEPAVTYEAWLNNAFKAYLPATAVPSGAQALRFTRGGDDETTSIDQLINTDSELVIYDLAGRRVQKMEKGIYIVNGKKVIK